MISVPIVICPCGVLAVRLSCSTFTTMDVELIATKAPTNAPWGWSWEGGEQVGEWWRARGWVDGWVGGAHRHQGPHKCALGVRG